jgi:glutathione S-transferase
MNKIKLYSFGSVDRASKVRWLAHELGLEIEEHRVNLGEHRTAPYRDINPYAAIPTVQWGDETWVESTAILQIMAERFPEKNLILQPGEAGRAEFLQWLAVTADTLESKLVEYSLVQIGILPQDFINMNEKTLQFKLRVALEQMPDQGYLVADRFTIADINLAYSLRLAVAANLISMESVRPYLSLLQARSAANEAGFFDSISDKF